MVLSTEGLNSRAHGLIFIQKSKSENDPANLIYWRTQFKGARSDFHQKIRKEIWSGSSAIHKDKLSS